MNEVTLSQRRIFKNCRYTALSVSSGLFFYGQDISIDFTISKEKILILVKLDWLTFLSTLQ